MSERRYRAPADDRAVLADPSLADVATVFTANRRAMQAWTFKIDHCGIQRFRKEAGREVLSAARAYHGETGELVPLFSDDADIVVGGHQPEWFHPGVWVKNFALARIASNVGGQAVNLVADHDTLKSATVRVPELSSDPSQVRLRAIPFDRPTSEQAYERREVRDFAYFADFPERVRPLTKDWPFRPMLDAVWPTVLQRDTPNVGERFAFARRSVERSWGLTPLELPVSRLSRTTAFQRFVRHIADDAARFRAIYNTAVRDYRTAHGIRSKNHPVPDLEADELPFWRVDGVRRGRWRHVAGQELPEVRPRALTLTLFSRVCLGIGFVHGLGGGIYDAVTDTIMQNWLGIEPPRYQVLTATHRLPFPGFPADATTVRQLRRTLRDHTWNPERYTASPNAELVARKRALAAEPWTDRKAWFRAFREINAALRVDASATETLVQRAEVEAIANVKLRRRDFAWCLFPEGMLRERLSAC